jgi:sugar/nucleoside kinase (ribokinase family)
MIISLGDAVADIVALQLESLPQWGEDRVVPAINLQPGGSALHVAVNLAALGAEVALMAGIGNDNWGEYLQDHVAGLGVDTSGIKTLAVPSAVTMVLSGSADRAFVSVYSATAAFGPGDLDSALLARATHVHVSGLWQGTALQPYLATLFDSLSARGVTLSLDTGYDVTGRWSDPLPDLLGRANLFFPNETEAMNITGQETPDAALAALAAQGPLVAMKLGAAGAHVQQADQCWRGTGFPVEVVGTTGAGDAFDAAFIYGWLRKWPVEETLRFANGAGAMAVARPGASEGAPTVELIQRFIRDRCPGTRGTRTSAQASRKTGPRGTDSRSGQI